MASIFRRPDGGKYLIEYTGADGRRHRKTGFASLKLTQQLAARLEKETAEGLAGMPRRRKAETIEAALAEYLADLRRLGRGAGHVAGSRHRIRSACRHQGWTNTSQINPTGLSRFLAHKSDQGRSGRTVNAYRDSIHWFCAWLVRQGRLAANPAENVPRGPQQAVRPRRALTIEELEKLCAAAPRYAAAAYRIAAYSGLRRKELRLARAGDVNRGDPEQWYWQLRPEANKSRRQELVPMLPECRAVLERLGVRAKRDDEPILRRVPQSETLKAHLEAAGVARVDARGRYADWHSLRYTFCTVLARHLPIQHVRLMMRHKDIGITVKVYLDLGITDVAESIAKLPEMFRKPTERK